MPDDPVVLELAPLPREQAGPFLILGIDKGATKEEIDAAWARRLIAARAGQIATPLEDVNWAREVLADWDRRAAADATALNVDTAAGELRRLLEPFGPLDPEEPRWTAHEPPLPEPPAVALPDVEQVRTGLTAPEVPLVVPAVERILREWADPTPDPWSLTLPADAP